MSRFCFESLLLDLEEDLRAAAQASRAYSTRSEAGTGGGASAGVYYPSSSSCEVPQKERLREKRKRKCVGYCVSLCSTLTLRCALV